MSPLFPTRVRALSLSLSLSTRAHKAGVERTLRFSPGARALGGEHIVQHLQRRALVADAAELVGALERLSPGEIQPRLSRQRQ